MAHKQIDYHLTTYICKHHRPHLEMTFNSPLGVKSVEKFIACPKCHQFGLEVKEQKAEKSYSMEVSF